MASTDKNQKLALDLLHADSAQEVIDVLKASGYWDNEAFWRLYGDKEGNFAQAGNQQALPEAALVEKLINSVDSRLLNQCLIRGINPESNAAPENIRDAVAMFFEDRRAQDNEAGTLINWSFRKRDDESQYITLAATGAKPTPGRKAGRMCLTIADQGEGQSAQRIPNTILSLNARNKQYIKFVQGKFNMGGSGVLRFCQQGLQLVISRRNPTLAARERGSDPTVDNWAVTIVRREAPSGEAGTAVHSECTYLAPVGADRSPRHGQVLSFAAKSFPLMPEYDEPYVRHVDWGTAIKLYEFGTAVGQSNILFPDGLLYALERLLPEVALPIRLHECREYKGIKERSFHTPMAGLVVRLEDGKGSNLEEGFPKSVLLQAAGMKIKGKIYAFKEDKAETYLRDEGIIFEVNGQAHGYLPKSLFARPKAVGLSRLKDSLLVLLDCSSLTVIQREDLFMSSRDRLSKDQIRTELEREIERMLREHKDLRRLQQERREQEIDSALSEERPLEGVLNKLLLSSPTLEALFLRGQRLARPFAKGGGKDKGENHGNGKDAPPYVGKRHPTYFKVRGIEYGTLYRKNCEYRRRCRISFVTDVEDEYFDRATDSGRFDLQVVDGPDEAAATAYSLALESGEAILNMSVPEALDVGDTMTFRATVNDSTLTAPFENLLQLTVIEQQERGSGDAKGRKRQIGGSGDDQSDQGIVLPKVVPVHIDDQHWKRYRFSEHTSCHVVSEPVDGEGETRIDHTFYINMDNTALRTEMKYSKQDPRLLEAKFKYANVLLGIAILYEAGLKTAEAAGERKGLIGDGQEPITPEDQIRMISAAAAPIVLPMIDQLAGLRESELEEYSAIGEDG